MQKLAQKYTLHLHHIRQHFYDHQEKIKRNQITACHLIGLYVLGRQQLPGTPAWIFHTWKLIYPPWKHIDSFFIAHSYKISSSFFNLEYNCFTLLYSFCCPTKWISYPYTYIPSLVPPSNPPQSQPSRSSQSTKLSSLCFVAGSH